MSAAKEYNKKINNLKEYAMCLHNIATEMLYHDCLETAKDYFERSCETFKSFGSEGIHYPINAIGVYYCLKNDYEKALEYFQKAYSDGYELFSRIGILINQATAYRNLKRYDIARDFLNKTDKLLNEDDAKYYAIIRQHYYLSSAINEKYAGQYQQAYSLFLEYFKIESNKETHRLAIAAKNLYELCENYTLPFPEDFKKYLCWTSEPINRLAPGDLVLVRFSFAE
jgi:tetratricopeptide (TPR) repeat protein